MTTMQKNVTFVAGAVLVVGVLSLLSETRRHRYVPVDDNHPRPLVVALCRDCHAPGKIAPQPPDHPPKDACMLCHRDPTKKK